MITEEMFLLAKKIVESYESNLNISLIVDQLSSPEECETEAILFTKKKMRVVGGLLSEDYKMGYKEGIEHYLVYINKL